MFVKQGADGRQKPFPSPSDPLIVSEKLKPPASGPACGQMQQLPVATVLQTSCNRLSYCYLNGSEAPRQYIGRSIVAIRLHQVATNTPILKLRKHTPTLSDIVWAPTKLRTTTPFPCYRWLTKRTAYIRARVGGTFQRRRYDVNRRLLASSALEVSRTSEDCCNSDRPPV